MATYKIIPSSSKKFMLTRDEVPAGELTYTNWTNSKADIVLADGTVFKLAPKGTWQTSTEISRDGVPLFSYKLGWNGVIIKSMDVIPHTYRLKNKGFWKSMYVLLDESDQELLLIESTFKWKGMKTERTLTPSITFEKKTNKELLMLICACAVNYQQHTAAVIAST